MSICLAPALTSKTYVQLARRSHSAGSSDTRRKGELCIFCWTLCSSNSCGVSYRPQISHTCLTHGVPRCHLRSAFCFSVSLPLSQRPGSVVVECSPGMQEVGGSIPGHVKQKTLKFEVLLLCLALSTKERLSGRLGVRIMVWVVTSLLTHGVVFQWASTIKTGRSQTSPRRVQYIPTTCSR